jgi:hypothetical protein
VLFAVNYFDSSVFKFVPGVGLQLALKPEKNRRQEPPALQKPRRH